MPLKISGDQFGKNVYTAEQITKAIAESNAQLGLSVDLGANYHKWVCCYD